MKAKHVTSVFCPSGGLFSLCTTGLASYTGNSTYDTACGQWNLFVLFSFCFTIVHNLGVTKTLHYFIDFQYICVYLKWQNFNNIYTDLQRLHSFTLCSLCATFTYIYNIRKPFFQLYQLFPPRTAETGSNQIKRTAADPSAQQERQGV